MIGRRRSAQTGFAGVVEDAALVGQAGDVVVHDTAVDGRYAGEDALVQGTRQRWQFAFQTIQGGAVGLDVGVQVAHGVVRDLMVETIEQDQDDVVFHDCSGIGSGLIACRSGFIRDGLRSRPNWGRSAPHRG
ncbi:hypothetical protein D3C77_511870 [compost metagenome]